MQHPDEGTIHAWLDGALSAEESARIEAHVASCDTCAPAVAEARGLIAASSRIAGHLDVVPANVIPAARKAKGNLWLRSRWPAAIAAALVIGVGFYNSRDRGLPTSGEVFEVPRAGVVRPTVTESTPASQPQARVEPRREVSADRRATDAVSKPPIDSITIPPASIAMQKAAPSPALQPPPAPRSAVAELEQRQAARAAMESRMAAAADAPRSVRAAVGSVAGGAAAPAAAPARADMEAPALPVTAIDTAFVGCYELAGVATASPVLPTSPANARQARTRSSDTVRIPSGFALDDRLERFALVDEAAPTPGQFAVRQVSAAGRLDRTIPGASWTAENGRAALRDTDGRIIITFTKTDGGVRGITTSGGRIAHVISCRK